ncbi:polysaccharide chain length determinant protein [Geotalea uraniireducens]|uniref:Polysaccharide chain length determinant protein n=1 Tax=Geotalea uraniireducens TaxID=351604 RepID=A0ABN6VY53_9BACT|nr:Wzz/FepE/Etk N-terminal domain-containing protein [Geotalea uraniireducens]BDV43452.1 polysaccharide chain length determinant protein [Geotalea uraniireducens]
MTQQQSTETNHGFSDPSETLDILEYLEIIAARKKVIIYTTGIAFLLSVVVSFSLPKIYSSTAMILPPQQDPGMLGLMVGQMGGSGMANLANDLLGAGNSADTYVSILNSNAVSDAIIDRFNLMKVYDDRYRFDTYKSLDKNVDISAGKKDGIISITVEDEDPQRAANMANAYVEELEKLTVQLNVTGASENKNYLEQRLVKSKGDLSKAEDAVKDFQSKYKMVSVSDQAAATIEGIAQIKAQLVSQEMQLAVLRRQFTDSSDEVISTKTSIANLKSQLDRLEGSRAGGAIPGVGAVPELKEQYIRLMREFKIQEALVELLTKQYEMTKLSEAKDVTSIQVIQHARVPDKKTKPKRLIIIMSATFLGGISAILYIVMRNCFANMQSNDIERWTRVKAQLFGSVLLTKNVKSDLKHRL